MVDIYDTGFVQKLFDEMAGTYDTVNYLSSFGFSKRWRHQFVRQVALKPGMVLCDLMCGMGECWEAIGPDLTPNDQIVALDFSAGMLRGATQRKAQLGHLNITLHQQDALANTLADNFADCVICSFGIKTLSHAQKELLAGQIKRILKPQGTFSLVEVSVPNGWWLRGLYMFYLKRIIPLVGRLLLGNPDNYRMLGLYTERFEDCQVMADILARHGLQVTYHRYFFGCASGVSGVKI